MWSGIEGIMRPLIQFIFSIIMARLLIPEDFGRFAMIAILVGISDVIADGGFGAALIQKKEPSENDYFSVFVFNSFIGLGIYSVIFLCAPLIADFYDEPILTQASRIFSLSIIIRALTTAQTIRIIKQLDYKKYAGINFVSISLASLTGIILAYFGFGLWALVIQTLLMNLIYSILVWTIGSWRPTGTFKIESLKSLFIFGSHILMASSFDIIYKNIYNIIIGKKFLAGPLGYYDRAVRVHQLPVENTDTILHRVLFPVFSSLQDDKIQLEKAFIKSLSMMSFITFPIIIFISLSSHPIINLLFGEKWILAASYLEVLIFSGLFAPIISLNNALIKASGRSKTYLYFSLANKIIITISILSFLRYGIIGLIYGQVISSLLTYIIYSQNTAIFLSISLLRQFLIIAPYLLISVFIYISIYQVNKIFNYSDLITILINFFLILFLYITLTYLIKKTDLIEFKSIIIKKIQILISTK